MNVGDKVKTIFGEMIVEEISCGFAWNYCHLKGIDKEGKDTHKIVIMYEQDDILVKEVKKDEKISEKFEL
jgi:hypothetical protein